MGNYWWNYFKIRYEHMGL